MSDKNRTRVDCFGCGTPVYYYNGLPIYGTRSRITLCRKCAIDCVLKGNPQIAAVVGQIRRY